jgi:uncharacterized protein
MLIEFSATNFRSIKGTQTLSMVANTFPEHAETNTFNPGKAGVGILLRTAVLYGPNAAGKTNVLLALQYMQSLVVNSASSVPGSLLPHVPFKLTKKTRSAPSELKVSFIQAGLRYEYGFSIDANRVRDEWLIEYANSRGRNIFERSYDRGTKDYKWSFSSFLKGQRSVWAESTRQEVLFLSMAASLNSKQLLPIFEWFQKRLVVIANQTTMNPVLTLQLLDKPDGKETLLPFFREADLGIAGIDMKREAIPAGANVIPGGHFLEQKPGTQTLSLVKVTFDHLDDSQQRVPLQLSEESAGTQLLFRYAGAWLNVLANGEVLLIDEIDQSLHPKLVRYLIEKFHSSGSNPHNAQMLFTTHNTSFLDQQLFRRDQIWFVEKSSGGDSRLYPLTDFKPRNDEILERWYMRGRYGALPVLADAKK